MSYGLIIQEAFAKAYAERGNATHALEQVLGKERAEKMQRHSLRARASDLLNHCHTAELIEQHKAEMQARGEPLPHYRARTYRADLISNEPKEDLPSKVDFLEPDNFAVEKLKRRYSRLLNKGRKRK